MAQEFDLRTEKLCLLGVQVQFVFEECLDDCCDILCVLFECFQPDRNIVHVHIAYLSYPQPQGAGDDPTLVNGRGVLYSHGHDDPFV